MQEVRYMPAKKTSAKSAKKTTKTAAKKAAKKTTKKVAKKTTKKKATKKKAAKKATKKTARKSTKKAAKKKATKKTTSKAKKSTQKAADEAAKAAATAMRDIIARARDHFRQAPEQHVFFVKNGAQLRNLRELAEFLEDVESHVFDHHVTEDRHDFANWVHEVLHERALAEQLRQAQRHPEAHQRVIYRHIVRRVW